MSSIKGLIQKIQNDIIEPIINLLFIVATLLFIWGIIQYVIGSQGDKTKLEQGKKLMLWGIIGMAVMASAWGFASILCNFFTPNQCIIPSIRLESGVQQPSGEYWRGGN